jgi:hypothetical protein
MTEVIIAVGGGSAIDTAKALMVGERCGELRRSWWPALPGQQPFVPTRSKHADRRAHDCGHGSEVTPWATVWDRERQKKYSLHLPETWPQPCGGRPGADAVAARGSHACRAGSTPCRMRSKSIWNVNANPLSDTFAVARGARDARRAAAA